MADIKCDKCEALQKQKDIDNGECWKCNTKLSEEMNSKELCSECGEPRGKDYPRFCKCGFDYFGKGITEPSPKEIQPSQNVVVTDIKMSFSSMVEFMVKWAIASIPALIILFIIGFFVASSFGVFSLAIFN